MRPLSRIAGGLLDRLLPSLCLGCAEPLATGRRPLHLCPACRGRLRPIDAARTCRRCLRESTVPHPGLAGWTCAGCQREPGSLERLVVPWRYEAPLDAVILALKLRRFDFLAADLVAEAIPRDLPARIGPVDLVVAVPMPWPRRLIRGVDAAAELTSAVARALGRPWAVPLRRAPWAPRQTGGSRDQRLRRVESTLRRCLRGAGADLVRNRRVLLVDDVVTTGSTLRATSRALRGLGASAVVALAFAATPPAAGLPTRPPGRHPFGPP